MPRHKQLQESVYFFRTGNINEDLPGRKGGQYSVLRRTPEWAAIVAAIDETKGHLGNQDALVFCISSDTRKRLRQMRHLEQAVYQLADRHLAEKGWNIVKFSFIMDNGKRKLVREPGKGKGRLKAHLRSAVKSDKMEEEGFCNVEGPHKHLVITDKDTMF